MTPLSGAALHTIEPWSYWHARAMVLAWGVLLPLGALVARFYKVVPGQRWPVELDRRTWWHGHRLCQWSGIALMTVGVALAAGRGQGHTAAACWHALGGWTLVALGGFQLLSGLRRGTKGGPTDRTLRGDHYDMTPRRIWFERLHKSVGWLAIVGSIPVIASGLVAADAPRWMPSVLLAWWAALAVLALRLQRAGRCIDTYQAIWGPDPVHPGNALRPVGWGVRRPGRRDGAAPP